MTTIKDIADRLGISLSTVSKGLNGANDISEELRQLVLDTAVEMGYQTKKMKKEEFKKLCLFIKNMDYEEVINRNGIPVLEYNDTIVGGINIQRGKEDFDLYPMTLNRDTVIVRRCWWLKAIRKADLLYVVFELKDSIPTSYPIYGYRYNPGKMPKVNDNFVLSLIHI